MLRSASARCACFAVLLSLGACSSSGGKQQGGSQALEASTPDPWTSAFLEPTGVIADVIEIEGPPALLDHFAGRQFPELVDYWTEATPEGMLHIYRRKDVHPIVEVSAQLDAWELAAFVELRVLFALDDRPVVLRAKGDATVRAYSGVDSVSGELLEYRGDPWAEAAAEEARVQEAPVPTSESISQPQSATGR